MNVNNSKMKINNTSNFIKNNNTVHKAPSFKGAVSVLNKFTPEIKDYKKLLKIASKDISNVGDELLSELLQTPGVKGKKIIIEKGAIQFRESTFLKSLMDSMTFPFTKLPLMLADFVLNTGKKVPGIKKAAGKLYDSKFLSKARLSSNTDDKINMLKGIITRTNDLVQPVLKKGVSVVKDGSETIQKYTIEELADLPQNAAPISNGLFKTANKFFDPKTGNYNTAHERPFNRIVTGLIPAFFLANDAYNLSVLCGDNKQTSDKEKKSRFHQEVSRVLTTAYLQLITLGSLTKAVNSNPGVSALISATTVLFSETFSRLVNGKPILFLSKEKAKEVNKKNAAKGKSDISSPLAAATEIKTVSAVNPQVISGQNNETFKSFGQFEAKTAFGDSDLKNKTPDDKKEQKTLITFSTLKKGILGLAGAGLALAFIRHNPKVNKAFHFNDAVNSVKTFWNNKIYNKLVTKDFELPRQDFIDAMSNLKKSGCEGFANKCENIVGDALNNETIKLPSASGKGFQKVNNKLKPWVDTLIQPFKFIWGALTLPFKMIKAVINAPINPIRHKIDKGIDVSDFQKKLVEFSNNWFGKPKSKNAAADTEILATNIGKIIKKSKEVTSGKITLDDFEKFAKTSIAKSFNNTTTSNYSNTDLAAITKISSSAVTSAFLVADNYNMVMLKSDGENKDDAKQKAQERIVQRISALFYQTLFMQWFNSTFSKLYHSSLPGVAAVSGANTVATEVFTRKSIGMPVGAKSFDELAEIDETNRNRKGLSGKYFRFMSKLTGKKPITKKEPAQKTIAFSKDETITPLKTTSTNLLEIYGSMYNK